MCTSFCFPYMSCMHLHSFMYILQIQLLCAVTCTCIIYLKLHVVHVIDDGCLLQSGEVTSGSFGMCTDEISVH